ncbi:MAG: DUF2569 family protein [Bacteroidetes bacterium]|nr:DUF2569 family protein [Bacteroidota bacterium]
MNFIYTDDFSIFLLEYINKNISLNTPDSVNFFQIFVLLVCSFLLSVLFIKLYNRQVNFKHYNPSEYDARLRKFGGLLYLLLPILVFDLIRNLYQLCSFGYLYTDKAHFFLTEINDTFLRNWWSIIIYFIVFTGSFKVVFSFFNLFFFINRKRLFKFLMLYYIPLSVIFYGIKYFLITQVVEPNHVIIYTVFTQWSESIYASVIIFFYILLSRRINGAFSK